MTHTMSYRDNFTVAPRLPFKIMSLEIIISKNRNVSFFFGTDWLKRKTCYVKGKGGKYLTLFCSILLISREDWGIPGNFCFNKSKIASALSSKSSLFSALTAKPHVDFPSFRCIFLCHITIDASILFLRSRTLCSVDKSIVERNCSGSKHSIVMLL